MKKLAIPVIFFILLLAGCKTDENIILPTNSPIIEENIKNEIIDETSVKEDDYLYEKTLFVIDENVGLEITLKGENLPVFSIIDPKGIEHSFDEDIFKVLTSEDSFIIQIPNPIRGKYEIKYGKLFKNEIEISSDYIFPEVDLNLIEVTNDNVKFNISGIDTWNGKYKIGLAEILDNETNLITLTEGVLEGSEYNVPIDTSSVTANNFTISVTIEYKLNAETFTTFRISDEIVSKSSSLEGNAIE